MRAAIRPAALVVAMVAGLAVVVGCGPNGSGASAKSGAETLVFTTHSLASSPVFTATASGVFAAAGGSVMRVGSSDDESRVAFAHGSFLVTHPHSQEKVTGQSVNRTTCLATETERAPYAISDGTGRYKGITGTGIATVTFTATLPKLSSGACHLSISVTPVPGTALTVIRGVGRVHLP